jgi:hypothetical protein
MGERIESSKGAHMPRSGTNSVDDRETIHELWLATQAAHNHYKSASAALDELRTIKSWDVVTSDRKPDVDLMVGIERTAFENYIEARLQLSESLLSRREGEPGHEAGSRSRNSGKALLAVIAALLCLMAFELQDLSQVRRQRRDLERGRDTAITALTQKQEQVETLAHQLEALKASNLAKAAATQVRISRPRSSRADLRRLNPNRGRIARKRQELAPLHKQGKRYYRESRNARVRRENVGAIVRRGEPNS